MFSGNDCRCWTLKWPWPEETLSSEKKKNKARFDTANTEIPTATTILTVYLPAHNNIMVSKIYFMRVTTVRLSFLKNLSNVHCENDIVIMPEGRCIL